MGTYLTLVLLVWVQLCPKTTALQCGDLESGCPISTSPAEVDDCNGVDKLRSVSYCGGFALCLGDGLGIRYRCPAGFIPGPRCVSENSVESNSTSSCPDICEDVDSGCPDGSADPGICPSPKGLFYLDDPQTCGQFVMCVLGQAFSFLCPDGYRSNAASSGPKCVPDYMCVAHTDPRLEVCENYHSGCGTSDMPQPTPICSQLTDSFGQFDHPDECGTHLACMGEGVGVTFHCPMGYRTDVLQDQYCILDPGCPTPVSPRLNYSGTGCQDVILGCAVRNTTSFDECRNKAPFSTNFNDPTRCGYYQKCTWGTGGYPAVEYVCPSRHRADVSQTRQICQMDDKCGSPGAARLSVVLKSAGGGETIEGRGYGVGGGRDYGEGGGRDYGEGGGRDYGDVRCSNVAFGCLTSDELTESDLCRGAEKWSKVIDPSHCDQYAFCLPHGKAVIVKCPLGYRARVTVPPYCLPDPSCEQG